LLEYIAAAGIEGDLGGRYSGPFKSSSMPPAVIYSIKVGAASSNALR